MLLLFLLSAQCLCAGNVEDPSEHVKEQDDVVHTAKRQR